MRTSPSGGRYIGQTTRTEAKRWRQHCELANKLSSHTYNTILSRAIRKYGGDNFSVEILEDNIPDDELDSREIYYIEHYHTFVDDKQGGYNMTRGGQGARKLDAKMILGLWDAGLCISEIYRACDYCYLSIAQLLKSHGVRREDIKARMGKRMSTVLKNKYDKKDSIYQLWIDGKNLSEIANALGTSTDTVSKYLREEYNVTPEEIEKRRRDTTAVKHIKNVAILQYTLNGDFVKEWELVEAVKVYPYVKECFHKSRKRRTCGNYMWRLKESNDIPLKIAPFINERFTPVLQYSLKGDFIKDWSSIAAASSFYNIDYSCIADCLKNRRGKKTACGYIWKYKTERVDMKISVEQYKSKHEKVVMQYDTDNNFIREWNSANEAARSLNGKGDNITACCRKEQHTAYGYVWRYKD